MRRHITKARAALLCLAPALVAWKAATSPFEVQPESRIWVSGTSTVRGWECKATAFDASVESTAPGAASAVLAGEKAVGTVAVTIPAAKLDCSNGKMNEHMLNALKARENPTIAFRLSSYDLAKGAEGVQVRMSGSLTLGGVEKPITLTATATEGAKGTLHVIGTHELRMTEFGLKPPTLMLGTMKVGDQVKVGFDFLLKD
jgi:polyisoprenoid-binding protein YceI